MALEINDITGIPEAFSSKKMIETDLEEVGAGGKRRNMAPYACMSAVGPDNHGHGIPANDALDPALDVAVAWKNGLGFHGDRIDIGGIGREGELNSFFLNLEMEPMQKPDYAFRTLVLIHVLQRVKPLPVFQFNFTL